MQTGNTLSVICVATLKRDQTQKIRAYAIQVITTLCRYNHPAIGNHKTQAYTVQIHGRVYIPCTLKKNIRQNFFQIRSQTAVHKPSKLNYHIMIHEEKAKQESHCKSSKNMQVGYKT